VTGGAGFIGRHLVARLVTLKAGPIAVLDNLYRACARADFPDSVQFLQADIRDREAVADAMRGCETVFHLAAQSNVMGAVADVDYAFSANVAGTYNVLRAARDAGVKRLVFTSSREVYGDPKTLPVRETAPLRPKNAYGASKAAAEVYCELAAREGLETVVLRLSNVYGPGDQDRVIPRFAKAATAGEPLTIYGAAKILDLIWAGTAVDAILTAGFGPWVSEPVNVASGKPVLIAELARRVVELTGSSSRVQVVAERQQEVGQFVADITLGKRLLGLQEPEDPLWRLPETLSGRF